MLNKNRIETFSDGVIAIINVMVFDMKIPALTFVSVCLYFAISYTFVSSLNYCRRHDQKGLH